MPSTGVPAPPEGVFPSAGEYAPVCPFTLPSAARIVRPDGVGGPGVGVGGPGGGVGVEGAPVGGDVGAPVGADVGAPLGGDVGAPVGADVGSVPPVPLPPPPHALRASVASEMAAIPKRLKTFPGITFGC